MLAFAALLSGCALWRPTTVPMASIGLPAPCAARPNTLLVMLPGAYSRPGEFVDEGFVDALRVRGIAADVVIADAHLGYYRDRSVVERLRADVIAPSLTGSYAQMWLVGISLGAYGAMTYARLHPKDEIVGIVAIGPYLGGAALGEQIAEQGGLRHWRAPVTSSASAAGEVGEVGGEAGGDLALWRWLQPYAADAAPAPAPTLPTLVLGYGVDDRFHASHALLAEALPRDRVFTAPGGHDWRAWRTVWSEMLDALPLPRGAGCNAEARAVR